ncbi:MAG: ribose 5-phosphate isomerase B [Candidatus Hydrogenedentes bacterium]|nr:ribose 5-phosphate isomerase B [Candidatus Hydrogenedentota bacterium]
MKIGLGCDHAGYEGPPPYYKPCIKQHLQNRGLEVIDFGTFSSAPVDYPDVAKSLCEAIGRGEIERGVLLCGTGIGMSISANKFPWIRAAVCTTPFMTILSRTHNDSNVLCLGRRILTLEECLHIINIWLDTPFSGEERHCRRIEKNRRLLGGKEC